MSQLSAPVRHPVLACADAVEDALKDALGSNPTFMSTDSKAEVLVRPTGLVDQLEPLRLRVIAPSGDGAAALDRRWTLLGEATSAGRVTLAQAEVIARALDNLDTDVDP